MLMNDLLSGLNGHPEGRIASLALPASNNNQHCQYHLIDAVLWARQQTKAQRDRLWLRMHPLSPIDADSEGYVLLNVAAPFQNRNDQRFHIKSMYRIRYPQPLERNSTVSPAMAESSGANQQQQQARL
jgi:hypothetical protein